MNFCVVQLKIILKNLIKMLDNIYELYILKLNYILQDKYLL